MQTKLSRHTSLRMYSFQISLDSEMVVQSRPLLHSTQVGPPVTVVEPTDT